MSTVGASDRKDSTFLRRETAALRDLGWAYHGFGSDSAVGRHAGTVSSAPKSGQAPLLIEVAVCHKQKSTQVSPELQAFTKHSAP